MNGSELYQYILDHTEHNLQGTWETTEQNQLKVTGTNVNGSYVVFNELGALNSFILEWEMTVLSSTGTVRINSGISPILLTDPTVSSVEGWNNGTITNAKFVYFMCNWNGSGDGNVGTLKSISDNGSLSNVNSSTGSFTVGTKYTYKLVRADGYLRLYQDNNLISEYQETTYADTPFYLGWYMWWGGTYTDYQANFIIDSYVITDLSAETINYVNKPGLAEIWANIKNYITAQLLGKSNTGHTHTTSDISNFPTIPTKTSDLTNDSGFLTSADRLPIGSYIQFAGSQAPEGFLVCNGGAISRTTYSKLFAVIGTKYGKGNGSTTFNLPNLTDRFLQGSTTSGTVKNAGLPNITAYVPYLGTGTHGRDDVFSGALAQEGSVNGVGYGPSGSWSLAHNITFNASRSSSIYGNSTTVQPPALTCLICIKY